MHINSIIEKNAILFKEPYRTCIKTCPTHKIAKKL